MPRPKDNLFFGLKLTDEQEVYVDSIFDNLMTIVDAKAGTGKTTIAIAAARLLIADERNNLNGLLYTFNPVEEGTMGYTDGGVEKKESKYISPLLDALSAINEDPRFALYRETNNDLINDRTWVEAKSHVFLRGTNIINKVVVIDESQNFSKGDLKKLLTRIHDNCVVIMIGHDGQIDLKQPDKSGFRPYLEHFKDEDYVKVCTLTHNWRGKLANHADDLSW